MAENIRKQRVRGVNDDGIQLVEYEDFGKDWVARFMTRHPQLNSIYRKAIEASRVKDVSVERLTKWFDDLKGIIEERNIEVKCINNVDEAALVSATFEASQCIINAEIQQQFQANLDLRNWWQLLSVFARMEWRRHLRLYLKEKNCHDNGYQLEYLK